MSRKTEDHHELEMLKGQLNRINRDLPALERRADGERRLSRLGEQPGKYARVAYAEAVRGQGELQRQINAAQERVDRWERRWAEEAAQEAAYQAANPPRTVPKDEGMGFYYFIWTVLAIAFIGTGWKVVQIILSIPEHLNQLYATPIP